MEDIRDFFPNHFKKRRIEFSPLSDFILTWVDGVPIIQRKDEKNKSHIKIESKMNKEPWGNKKMILRIFFSKRTTDKVAENQKTFVTFLKSNLQKAIRRCNSNIALATTKLLLELDPSELLRRLPIILLEDVGIHKCILPITLLMVICSKNYTLEDNEKNYILGVVNWMCNWNKQVVPEKRDQFIYENIDEEIWDKLDDNKKNAFISLYIRINYGGMNGDMKMIRFWMEYILLDDCELWTSDITPISYDECHNFVFQTHVLDCAIDFHICSYWGYWY